MTIESYKSQKAEIESNMNAIEAKLRSFEKGPMGLVTITPEYREVKSKFDFWFKKLQDLNKSTPKSIHTQIKNERRASWKS